MIYQKNNLKIIRPLLNMHRFEIRQFVCFWQLPIYSDQSNQKTTYLRNKIRKQLMPTLRIFFNPHIDTVLLNFVNIRKNEQWYFQKIVNSLLRPELEHYHPLFLFFLKFKRENFDRVKNDSFIHKNIGQYFFGNLRFQRKAFVFDSYSPSIIQNTILDDSFPFFTYLRSVKICEAKKILKNIETISGKNPHFFRETNMSCEFCILDPCKAAFYHASYASYASYASSMQQQQQQQKQPKKTRAIWALQGSFLVEESSKRIEAERIGRYHQVETLHSLSRNQVIFWLIVNTSVIRKFNNYPNIFQKQILKTTLKTFNQVDSAFINLHSSGLLINSNHFANQNGNSKKEVTHIPGLPKINENDASLILNKSKITNLSEMNWMYLLTQLCFPYLLYVKMFFSFGAKDPFKAAFYLWYYLWYYQVVRVIQSSPMIEGKSNQNHKNGQMTKFQNFSIFQNSRGGINSLSTITDLLAIQSNRAYKTGVSDLTYIYEKKLTQVFVLKFLKRLFFLKEKKIFVIILNNLIKKYKNV